MKACVIQPPYSRDVAFSDEFFRYKLDRLSECDDSLDIIVLPEYSDVPCATKDLDETLFYHKKYIDTLLESCKETAKRCNSLVFVNALSLEESGYRNTTYAFNRQGELVGKYFKKHLPPLELETLKLDSDYTFKYSEPYVLEVEGLRFGFLTCYDFYFYEAFANIARQKVDIIIGCSLQRSDTHDAIGIMCRFLAYNTNAYVIRSSVSFAEDSNICGASMIVDPFGKILANMKGKFGRCEAEFDPTVKYLKPAGYGNPDAPHWQYIEYGRKPWQYRNGSMMAPFEDCMKYPRICAHRGFSAALPENTLPAFGAAVAMGADEIEFDIWPTADGHIVSCHDSTLDRVSDGRGKIFDKTLDELLKLDFGSKFDPKFKGLKIATFEEILAKLGGQTVMNIHVKPMGEDYPKEFFGRILSLIRKHDCQRHCYLMIEKDNDIRWLKENAPDIPVCVGHDSERPWEIVDRAIELGAQKVQFFKPYFSKEMVEKAHSHGILCNVFWSDDPKEAKQLLDMGMDTILTNNYGIVSQILKP